jgi:hypothetical protein
VGLLLLTATNLFQVIGTYAADWNKTHIYNPNWPPHAIREVKRHTRRR